MDIPEVAFLATREVIKNIKGRVADGGVSLPWLASMALQAGTGDHLDIGTLFGASALVVALAKKWAGIEGEVYCIDPWEVRSGIAVNAAVKPEEICAAMQDVSENAERFGVPLKLIKAKSEPVPPELEGHSFASVYIDGDHLKGQPLRDFQLYAPMVTKYIGFDNYEEGYPDVMAAVRHIMLNDQGWVPLFKNMTFFALRRRMPGRHEANNVDLARL